MCIYKIKVYKGVSYKGLIKSQRWPRSDAVVIGKNDNFLSVCNNKLSRILFLTWTSTLNINLSIDNK